MASLSSSEVSVDELLEVEDVSDDDAETAVLRAGLTTKYDVRRVVGCGKMSARATLAGKVLSVVSVFGASKSSILVTGRECAVTSCRRTAQLRSPHSSERNIFFALKMFAMAT